MIALMMYFFLVTTLSSCAPIELPLSSPPQSRVRRSVLWGDGPQRVCPFHVRPNTVPVELQGMAVGTFDRAIVRALGMYADAPSALPTVDRFWWGDDLLSSLVLSMGEGLGHARSARTSAPRASLVVIAGALLAARLVASAACRDATTAESPGALVALARRGLLLAQEASKLLRRLLAWQLESSPVKLNLGVVRSFLRT